MYFFVFKNNNNNIFLKNKYFANDWVCVCFLRIVRILYFFWVLFKIKIKFYGKWNN